jgi:hypothetical protein
VRRGSGSLLFSRKRFVCETDGPGGPSDCAHALGRCSTSTVLFLRREEARHVVERDSLDDGSSILASFVGGSGWCESRWNLLSSSQKPSEVDGRDLSAGEEEVSPPVIAGMSSYGVPPSVAGSGVLLLVGFLRLMWRYCCSRIYAGCVPPLVV